MPQPFIVISPMLPPMRGGLPDHTHRLALELSHHFEVTVVSSEGVNQDAPFSVLAQVRNWGNPEEIEAALAKLPSNAPILWQYVPHMYGRGGVNRELPKILQKLRKMGRKQVLVAHEIAAGLSWRPHWLWFALNHRWQWRRLARTADLVPISTERWVEEWSIRWPALAAKFFVLPSPSSIPRCSFGPNHKREWRMRNNLPPETLVIAYFGTVSAAKQFDWVVKTWNASSSRGKPVALAVIGGSPPEPPRPSENAYYRPLGFLSASDVSGALTASDVLVLPFIDGVSERRTTFMAGLDHSVATSTTTGHNTGQSLQNAKFLLTAKATDPASFIEGTSRLTQDIQQIAALANAGKAFHDSHFQWPVVVNGLIERMLASRLV